MQIVIDIPKKVYNALTHIGFDANLVVNEMRNSIANGTPLPKGHGRLIDADSLMEYCYNQKSREIDCNDIARFPTVLRRYNENKNI